MAIEIKENYTVKPAIPTDPAIKPIRLSNNDLTMPRIYISFIYFFKNKTQSPEFMPFNLLYSSLQDLLVDYYPLAGRLLSLPNGALELVSNDAGALLVDAASDFTFEYFRATNWDPMSIPAALAPKNYIPKPGDPLFAAQVTRLACGSIALGVNMDHSVCDGHSYFTVVDAWSRKARGLELEKPFLDREVLRATGEAPTHEHPEYKVEIPAPAQPRESNTPAPAPFVPPPMTRKAFVLSIDDLKELKAAANADEEAKRLGNWASTGDAIAALLFRSVTKAKGLDGDTKVILGTTLDGRERLENKEQLKNYFGNLVLFPTIQTSVSSLLALPLSYSAQLLRASNQGITASCIRSSLNWVERVPDKTTLRPGFDVFGPDFSISNVSGFPIYKADFGYGVSTKCRSIKWNGTAFDRMVFLLAGGPNGKESGVEFVIELETKVMEKMLMDEEFSKFAKIVTECDRCAKLKFSTAFKIVTTLFQHLHTKKCAFYT
ncbi:transferase [Endogone sp. FLAS-F59071]|nr:transferase [Endogone sp. FLAS-F59071]|eukprot:RUS16166.1 transferase [Endogone sp. FLAS-F59071]